MSDPDTAALVGYIGDRVERLARLAEGAEERALVRAPSPGGWSARHVLAHVAEFLPYWAEQALAVAGRDSDGQPFGRTHTDPERLGAVDRHAGDPLPDLASAARQAAAAAAATLARIPPARWERTGTHARRGEMSVRAIVVAFLVTHLDEHLAQAEEALGAAS